MINEHGMTCMRPEHYRLPAAIFFISYVQLYRVT